MQEDFYVVFFSRNDSNYGWYKLLSRKGNFWEKIEIRQNIIEEQQLREDPDYYISRDITTRKLCRDEEAKLFLSKLKSYGLFELPEEKVLFRNCEDSKVTDMGYKYILIVSGNKCGSWNTQGSTNVLTENEIIFTRSKNYSKLSGLRIHFASDSKSNYI